MDRTLVDVARRRAAESPEARLYTFLADGEREQAHLTFAGLDRAARSVAARLEAEGLAGERALLLFPPGLELVTALFGCLYAGVVAVPAYPPNSRRTLPRLLSILADAEPRAALTTGRLLPRLVSKLPAAGSRELRWLATDEPSAESARDWRNLEIDPGASALLQYTSGSTAEPKGVELTHANLMANEERIRRAFGQSEESVVVGWLPLFHDMGLIGNLLQPLYSGGRAILMSPVAFLTRPRRWLEAITRYRADTSGGPDFAYELCLRKVGPEERRGLDLGSWRVAFNGAEPVRARVLAEFARAFAGCAFRAQAFFPCYGLAEATLFVAGGGAPRVESFDGEALRGGRVRRRTHGAEGGRELVSCGRPAPDHELAIVDPERRARAPEGRVGEIWVAGPSVARCYRGRPELTEATFGARLVDDPEAGPFLRTGDLGFLDGGELFVTGRAKDLIIVRGLNYYPQDVEDSVARCHAELGDGAGAAFAVEGADGEGAVVVWEVGRGFAGAPEAICDCAREAVLEEQGLALHEVVLVEPGEVPRTTSGKVRRRACAEAFCDGRLAIVGRSGPPSPVEADPWLLGPDAAAEALAALDPAERRRLVALWLGRAVARAGRLGAGGIDPAAPLTRSGIDSLAAAEVQGAVEERFGVRLDLGRMLDGASLAELAAEVADGIVPATAPAGAPEPAGTPPADGELPLTAGQRALWFLHRLAPESSAYQISAAAEVRGELELPALRRALAAAVRRQPALRATFHDRGGEPFQRLHDRLAPEVVERDGRSLGPEELRRALAAEAHRPFDLEAGPLLRLGLWRRGPGTAVLLLAVHHLVADLRSLANLLRDLESLYRRETGRPAPAPPPPATGYERLARREQAFLESRRGRAAEEYWRRTLSPPPPDPALPADRRAGEASSFRGATCARRLPDGLSQAVAAAARGGETTRFVVTLAAFQALLHRYSGETDLAVGTVSSGRGRPEAADLVGYLVNPLVLRGDLRGDPPFAELVERTRGLVAAALSHADYPFPLLAERLGARREDGRQAFFRAMFLVQDLPAAEDRALAGFGLGVDGARASFAGLTLTSLAVPEEAAQFDLTLQLAEAAGALHASLQYSTDLFDAATADRLLEHYELLLAGAVAAPGRPLSLLPLLSEAERAQLLAWGDGARLLPGEETLHGRFAEQARRTPERVALVWEPPGGAGGTRFLSYGELAERAGRLARRLRHRGAGPEVPVGVCLERGPEAVVALLAVLEAGAAYVPLDPAYPRERLAAMLRDAGAGLAVGRPPSGFGTDAVEWLAAEHAAVEPEGAGPAGLPAGAGNLAYLLFTSGSTGRPKGVAIEHRSAVALLDWAATAFAPGELAAVLASTSLSFDLSVFELFVPLTRGGTVILAADALALRELRGADRVTLVNTVPSAMAELAAGELPAALRTVNLAGEPLPRELADRVHGHRQVLRVMNLYGPSEDTTYSTFAEVPPGPAPVTIGRPVAGGRARILDGRMQAVPAGVQGELYLGGAGLARGYLGRPALTAERFVPDPAPVEPGARLYRTGDLARFRADGEIEFLGRFDQQVKLRGFRIELGEVEAALRSAPGIEAAAVVVREDLPAGPGLAAFLVAAGPAPREAEVHAALTQRLPRFMHPARLVWVEALPLSPNGKVDRRSLAGRALADAAPPAAEATPRGPLEEIVAGAFAAVLGRPRVEATESFFDLGGHSLAAMRLLSRLRDSLGVDLPVREVFRASTPRALAERVEDELAAGRPSRPEPVRPTPRAGPLPLSFAQRRLWFLDRLHPGQPTYHLPLEVRISGDLRPHGLARALAAVVARHEVLRVRVAPSGGEPRGRVEPAVGGADLPRVDLSALPAARRGAERRRLARAEARRPFDLAAGPPLRASLAALGGRRWSLLVTLHHIAGDAWSLAVLLEEVSALYRAFVAGGADPLAPLPVQYADFAIWQRRSLDDATEARLLDYWRARLAGAPELGLPADRPRPPGGAPRGGERGRRLPGPLASEIEGAARRFGVTPFMVVLTGLATLLARLTGDRDLVVGAPIAQRDRPEIEGLIGPFVNTLALRLDLSGDPTGEELLARVRRSALEAYAHRDLPFERLVDELGLERSLDRSPLFQVMLAWQRVRPVPGPPPGLAWRAAPVATGAAKFDLSLLVDAAGEGMEIEAVFKSDLFDGVTVERWLAGLELVLGRLVTAPELRLAQLCLPAAAERHQILLEWNDSARIPPATEDLLHRPFERRAAESPEAVAVRGAAGAVTYGRLEALANRLARRLAAQGAGPERLVAVRLEPSAELLAALLAVLKCGAAFLPLDPDDPPERTSLILEDARPALLLTDSSLPALPAAPVRVVHLDREAPALVRSSPVPQEVPTTGASLAYVIYTSGSTGRPKGVMVEHRSAAAYLRWVEEELLGPRAGALPWLTRITFDAALKQVFWPLGRGGAVEVVPPAQAVRPAELLAWLDRNRAAGLNCVPSLWSALLEAAEAGLGPAPRGLRHLFLGGEELSADLVSRTRALVPGAEVVNLYGPTEATANACWERAAEGGRPSLGRPLAGRRVHVLDPWSDPAPIGAAGEICLGGEGVGLGYLGRPGATAERFRPDPYAAVPGERLYHTGDRGRRRPDGALDFLGRLDEQVKLRGIRIELGEVEAALRELPGVREAAAALHRDGGSGPEGGRLVAYLVCRDGELPVSDELRRRLVRRLPAAMVPAHYLRLDQLPRTATGKIDRRRLPAPAEPASAVAGGGAPRSALEEVLAGIMAEVLGVERVGVHDNFFELGGHSLQAADLIARVQEAFEVDLPMLHVLFDAPTVASLAEYLADDPLVSGRLEGAAPLLLASRRGEAAPGEGRA